MNKISAIQVIIDPLAAVHPAIEKAAILATKFDARIELLLCDTKSSRATRLAAHHRADNRRVYLEPQSLLNTLATSLREQKLVVTTQVESIDPLHVGLLRHINKGAADLVIKDTHHHSFLKRTFITNTDWHLIRECRMPLLLTKVAPWKLPPTFMAAIDPSHVNDKPATLDQQLLDWAALLAEKLAGSLHVAHAFIPTSLAVISGSQTPIAVAITPEMVELESAERMTQVQIVTKGFKINPEHIHLELGSAGDVLPEVSAKWLTDVLVTGAISRGAIAQAFIGSTAEQIIERTSCDLLVIKPLDFSADLPF